MRQATMNDVNQPLSIIVPTLNEVDNLELLLSRIDASLSSARIGYEVVLVDDHSSDGTVDLARKLAAYYPIRIFEKEGKRGKAYSLLEGFDHAEYELVCMIDADLQYPPEAIAAMYKELTTHNADLVITKRIEQQTSLLRQLSTKVFNLVFTRLLFGIHYDTQSGLKLFKKQILQHMVLSPSPWSFDLEFIVRALENDDKIMSHDIQFGERYAGQAKVHVLAASVELAKASLKLRRDTSVKRVRLHYKQNLELSRSILIIFAVAGSLLYATLGSVHTVSALPLSAAAGSITTTEETTLTKAETALDTLSQSLTTKTTAPSTTSAVTTTSPGTTTAPTTTNSSSTSVASSTIASPATPSTPTAAAATTPASSNVSTSKSAAAATTPSTVASATSAAGSSVVANAAQTKPAQAIPKSSATAQSADYYTSHPISSSTRSTLMTIALRTLEIGSLLIVLGIGIVSVKISSNRFRNYA
jgi:glycosyltransferase involved in cell wall biosynthesis